MSSAQALSTSAATPAAASSSSSSAPPSIKKTIVTLGSRSSELALKQTHIVRDELQALYPDYDFPIVTMNTAGDKNQSQALYLMGGKALWTEELEACLVTGQIDIIVHSLKDIPTSLAPEFTLAAVLERADPRDALVVKKGLEDKIKTLEDLPAGSVVGTSSVRRVAQLRRLFPSLEFMDARGNLNTRLAKLDAETSPFTALILAHAGLSRINLGHRSTSLLSPPSHLYAVGQGALGIEIRSNDPATAALCDRISHWPTHFAIRAERGCLRTLEGGCSVPVGVHSAFTPAADADAASPSGTLDLIGSVTSLDGEREIRFEIKGRQVASLEECERLGVEVAQGLVERGAGSILKEIEDHKNAKGTVEGEDVLHPAAATASPTTA